MSALAADAESTAGSLCLIPLGWDWPTTWSWHGSTRIIRIRAPVPDVAAPALPASTTAPATTRANPSPSAPLFLPKVMASLGPAS
jgi:hypothetical protein